MIPQVVPRQQLLAANGVFTLTLNAAFAIGFALLGPLVVNIAGAGGGDPRRRGAVLPRRRLLLHAAGVAAADERGRHGLGVAEAEHAVGSTVAQLREGIGFIRGRTGRSAGRCSTSGSPPRSSASSACSARSSPSEALGPRPKDFAVVVLPLGFGIVMGILLLNSYGRYLPRRRVIEGGLIALGILLRAAVGRRADQPAAAARGAARRAVDLSAVTSLLAVVVFIALRGRHRVRVVAIPAQTQLQEDLPEEVRGRVFGVLNMLVSVSSFLPIIIVGPISDLIGTTAVILVVGIAIVSWPASRRSSMRGPLRESDAPAPRTRTPSTRSRRPSAPTCRPGTRRRRSRMRRRGRAAAATTPSRPPPPTIAAGAAGPSDPADRD